MRADAISIPLSSRSTLAVPRARELAALCLALACALPANAADKAMRDMPGVSDSPVVSRYQGSVLYAAGGEALGFSRMVDVEKGKPVLRQVEGKINNRFYLGPKGISSLDVVRNYRQALEAAGFQIVYACEESQCKKDDTQRLVQDIPREAQGVRGSAIVRSMFNSGNRPGFNLVSARKASGNGHVHVLVAMSFDAEDQQVQQLVQVVEPATAQTGKVTVDAKAIGDILQREGRIALYGVNFDTNKAVLRADSDEQLKQMAAALGAASALKVFIIGHTDNQGDFEANMKLSQRRAEAVAEALTTRYGIAAGRMTARGVANMAPVAPNKDEAGRARNRRVELVLR